MSKATRRYYRTILLGVAAMAALVWSAVDQFGIPWEDMLDLFLGTLLVVVLAIAFSALLALLWAGVRKLLRRGP